MPHEVFPARMVAVCAVGHTWPVEVTWREVLALLPPRLMRVPDEVSPRFCLMCWEDLRAAQPYVGLRYLDDACVEAAPTTPVASQ